MRCVKCGAKTVVRDVDHLSVDEEGRVSITRGKSKISNYALDVLDCFENITSRKLVCMECGSKFNSIEVVEDKLGALISGKAEYLLTKRLTSQVNNLETLVNLCSVLINKIKGEEDEDTSTKNF
jgi:hypothetical protein